jgi:hypothetical protein
MMKENIIVTENNHQIHRICWSAVLAGAFVGIGLGFLLHLYGIAISLSAYSAATDSGASVIAIGGLLGMILGVIAATAASGFVAGYLGRFHYHAINGGIIYGFITWSIVIFLSAIMVAPMENYVTAYKNSLTNTAVIEGPVVKTKKVALTQSGDIIQKKTVVSSEPVAQVTPNQLAWSGWVIFILFFIGAISSCVGASCGLQCKREYPLNHTENL